MIIEMSQVKDSLTMENVNTDPVTVRHIAWMQQQAVRSD